MLTTATAWPGAGKNPDAPVDRREAEENVSESHMKAIRLMIGVVSVVGAVVVGLVVRATAQALPEGPNKALAEKLCGSCHDTEMVAVNGRSRENWNGTIDEMVGYGMEISPTDRATLLDHLATYLPPK
jgi:hypothetical protein